MGYQQPGQQSFLQPVTQQGGATHSSQQQVVAAVQNPWDTDYNPYQQYADQVS